jgi:GDP-D-mannose 3', 5'-epimerase
MILVAGAGGFIGGHLVKRLLDDGFSVRAVDKKRLDQWEQVHSEAENLQLDLSWREYSDAAVQGCAEVYNLAADMGGMGFITTHRVECMNSVEITVNLLRSCVKFDAWGYLHASSACVYPDFMQNVTDVSLKESDAWPADPEPGYGLEKLYAEELCKYYRLEKNLHTRIPRFHNVYGPYGTYKGGREKAPAAICRKVIEAKLNGTYQIEVWGDGEQTRSFMYVDDCVEGVVKLMDSSFHQPLNLGSSELVTVNQLVDLAEDIAGYKVERVYDPTKPQGVRGRNSDNTLIKAVFDWEPSIPLQDGLATTFEWIYNELAK